MSKDIQQEADKFYRDLIFELLINIKAVNSGIYDQYICEMEHRQKVRWDEFVETLKEAGWIP